MSVLARDLQAYQDAVDQYQRRVRSYNNSAAAYNSSIVRDANGNVYISDLYGNTFAIDPNTGSGPQAAAPIAATSGNVTPVSADSNGYYYLRQNPIATYRGSATIERDPNYGTPVSFLRQGEDDGSSFIQTGPNLVSIPSNVKGTVASEYSQDLARSYQVPNPFFAERGDEDPFTEIRVWDVNQTAYVYPDSPTAPVFSAKAPDPSIAQLKRLRSLSAVDRERGLISDVISKRGGGLVA